MAVQNDLTASFRYDEVPRSPIEASQDIIARINEILSANFQRKSKSDVKNLLREIIDVLNQLTEEHENLQKTAADVAAIVSAYFDPSREHSDLSNESELVKAGVESLRDLIDDTPPSVNLQEVTIYPNDLPRVEGLASQFLSLRKDLKKLMTNARDPNNSYDSSVFTGHLSSLCNTFQELTQQWEEIYPSLAERAQRLDEHVEKTRLEAVKAWIDKEACLWSLKRGEIFADVIKPLEALQEEIGSIHTLNESIKKYLPTRSYDSIDKIKVKFELIFMGNQDRPLSEIRDQIRGLIESYPSHNDTQTIDELSDLLDNQPSSSIRAAIETIKSALENLPESFVDKALEDYRCLIRRFNTCKESAEFLMVNALETIQELRDRLEENGRELEEIITAIPLHDENGRKGVIAHLEQTIEDMKTEKVGINTTIEGSIEQIIINLSSKNKGATYYELVRVGYWMLDNMGVRPTDATSNWYYVGWNPTVDYVTPFADPRQAP